MATNGVADTSARAEISGVMVLDAIATTPGKPKTLYITGAFYTPPGPILGVFKYFNKYDYDFLPKSRWFVNTTVGSYCISSVSATERNLRLLCLTRQLFLMQGSKSIPKMRWISWEIYSM